MAGFPITMSSPDAPPLSRLRRSSSELEARMTDADATHVVTDSPNAEKVGKVCDQISLSDENRFVLGEAEGFISILGFEHLDNKDFREVAVLDPPNTLAAIAFSSGTGGQVKGVEITHYSFVANMVQNKNTIASDETDVLLAWNPVTHTCGFLFTMLAALRWIHVRHRVTRAHLQAIHRRVQQVPGGVFSV
ncbi:hypothetical protein MRX96_010945 [Rhipicephalus microplus]